MTLGILSDSLNKDSKGNDDIINLVIGRGVKNCPSFCLIPSSRKPSNKSPKN